MSRFTRVLMVAVVGLVLASAVVAQGTQSTAKATSTMQQDSTKKKDVKGKKGKKGKKGGMAKDTTAKKS